MIGLDTNVLVRYFVQDDESQAAAAARVIDGECSPDSPGFVSQVTLVEFMWVLTRGYGFERADVLRLLRGLLSSETLEIERADLAWLALGEAESGKADFADYLIAFSGRDAGASATLTFDKRAAATPLFRLLKP